MITCSPIPPLQPRSGKELRSGRALRAGLGACARLGATSLQVSHSRSAQQSPSSAVAPNPAPSCPPSEGPGSPACARPQFLEPVGASMPSFVFCSVPDSSCPPGSPLPGLTQEQSHGAHPEEGNQTVLGPGWRAEGGRGRRRLGGSQSPQLLPTCVCSEGSGRERAYLQGVSAGAGSYSLSRTPGKKDTASGGRWHTRETGVSETLLTLMQAALRLDTLFRP